MHVITFSMLGALPEEGMHLGKKKQKRQGSHERNHTEGAHRWGGWERPYLKSVDVSKKAHNGAASSLSMEHFVLQGCFTTRLFSSCQDHRNPQGALPEKVAALHKWASGRRGDFKPSPQGNAWALSRLWCKSGAGVVLLFRLWWHYSLGTCLCFSHFAVVFLTLCFYRRVLQQVWGKWHHQPSVQSA